MPYRGSRPQKRPGLHFKVVYLVVAAICIVVGIIGLIVPIIPGVLFLVAAVYFLGKVSNRIRRWADRQPVLRKIQNKLQQLNTVAQQRSQTLAQLALSWVLRDSRVTSALIGASKPQHIIENVKAAEKTSFSQQHLDKIDQILSALSLPKSLWADTDGQ